MHEIGIYMREGFNWECGKEIQGKGETNEFMSKAHKHFTNTCHGAETLEKCISELVTLHQNNNQPMVKPRDHILFATYLEKNNYFLGSILANHGIADLA